MELQKKRSLEQATLTLKSGSIINRRESVGELIRSHQELVLIHSLNFPNLMNLGVAGEIRW